MSIKAMSWAWSQEISPTDVEREEEAVSSLKKLASELASTVGPIWKWGDGYGGYVFRTLESAFVSAGLPIEQPEFKQYRPFVSRSMREKVIAKCGLVCSYCGKELDPSEATLDHIIPISKGGPHEVDNLTIACRPCNSRKGAR